MRLPVRTVVISCYHLQVDTCPDTCLVSNKHPHLHIACTTVGLEDLQSAPEPHYEQLRIHNPRVYMEGGQGLPAQMQQSLSISSAGAGAGADAAGATASEALARLDPDDLADTPMAPATAQQVRFMCVRVANCATATDGQQPAPASSCHHEASVVLQPALHDLLCNCTANHILEVYSRLSCSICPTVEVDCIANACVLTCPVPELVLFCRRHKASGLHKHASTCNIPINVVTPVLTLPCRCC